MRWVNNTANTTRREMDICAGGKRRIASIFRCAGLNFLLIDVVDQRPRGERRTKSLSRPSILCSHGDLMSEL